jgi:hypothetical protein
MSILEAAIKQKKELLEKEPARGELVQSFQIPIEFPYNGTKFRGYVTISAEGINSIDDLNAALKQIDDAFGIYIYQKQQNGGFKSYGNNNYNNNNRGWRN